MSRPKESPAPVTTHSRAIARNAAVVGLATLASRILGFVRDLVTAFALGAGLVADAFFVAFRLPNLLRSLFAEGSLTMAFIPVYSRIREEQGEAAAHALARSIQMWLLVVVGGVCILAVIFAAPLTGLIAPGFRDNPEQFALTVHLVRICFPYILFVSAMALCMGILNSMGHFLMPALGPCALNVCLIAAALVGHYALGDVATAMAFGVLVAGLTQWAMQQPALWRRGFSWRGEWSWRHPGVFRVGKLMLPTVIGAAVYQINILLSTLLASLLPTGSVSYLYYADRLVQFPLGVFGVAVATAALPSLAKLAASDSKEEFAETLESSLGLITFISLPSAVGLIALSGPIVELLFMRGAFTQTDATATMAALAAYGVGLPAVALVRPYVSAFYARENTRTPVIVAFVSVLTNVTLGYALMQHYAHVGLAVAVSVAGFVNVAILAAIMRREVGRVPRIGRTALISGLLSAGVGLGCLAVIPLGKAVAIGSIPVFGALYVAAAWALRVPEARLFTSMLARRFTRNKAA
ncbi:integral membrane protein MviN [Alkalidesulfovibrio alkalitolerans DSM 16529]|uniref:Probable lipid II flippase MurJ n=1 Tax=Alkalidesulfovibrio alkalitolerans DSM 16529 TaxID=1121439 RepID=S7TFG6_9BACT|nr:integral membrane protein MviN [Alkalidesulfovibrio alkalitolerans DSM 16529]